MNKNTRRAQKLGFSDAQTAFAHANSKDGSGESRKVFGKNPNTKGQPCPTAFGHSPHSKRKSRRRYPRTKRGPHGEVLAVIGGPTDGVDETVL